MLTLLLSELGDGRKLEVSARVGWVPPESPAYSLAPREVHQFHTCNHNLRRSKCNPPHPYRFNPIEYAGGSAKDDVAVALNEDGQFPLGSIVRREARNPADAQMLKSVTRLSGNKWIQKPTCRIK